MIIKKSDTGRLLVCSLLLIPGMHIPLCAMQKLVESAEFKKLSDGQKTLVQSRRCAGQTYGPYTEQETLACALARLGTREVQLLERIRKNIETSRNATNSCMVEKLEQRGLSEKLCEADKQRYLEAEINELPASDQLKNMIKKPEFFDVLARKVESDALTVAAYAHIYANSLAAQENPAQAQENLRFACRMGASLVDYAVQLFSLITDVTTMSFQVNTRTSYKSLEELMQKNQAIDRVVRYHAVGAQILISALQNISNTCSNWTNMSDNIRFFLKKSSDEARELESIAQKTQEVLKRQQAFWFAHEIQTQAAAVAHSARMAMRTQKDLEPSLLLVQHAIATFKQNNRVTLEQRTQLNSHLNVGSFIESLMVHVLECDDIERTQNLLWPLLTEGQQAHMLCDKDKEKIAQIREVIAESKDLAKTLLYACPVCAAQAQNCCGRCGKVFYCSPEHQKKDWDAHKKQCRYFVARLAHASDSGEDDNNQLLFTDNSNTNYAVDARGNLDEGVMIRLIGDVTSYSSHFDWRDVFGFVDDLTNEFYPLYPDDASLKRMLANPTYNDVVKENLRKANQAYHRLCDEKSVQKKEKE